MNTSVLAPAALNEPIVENAYNPSSVRFLKRFLALIFIVTILIVAAIIVFNAFIVWKFGRPDTRPLSSNPAAAFGADYIDVRFPSRDGRTMLSGWYIPGAGDRTVIFSHGYGGNREEPWVPILDLAAAVHQYGYNVLMFDYGYVNRSSGRVATGGVKESLDLLGAIDFAKRHHNAEYVYVWGFSMGAGTALYTALHTDEINAMILDSTFLLNAETLTQNIKLQSNIPLKPSVSIIRALTPIINNVRGSLAPYEQIAQTQYTQPILFIHGKKDRRAPYGLIESIYGNQSAYAELWLHPKRGHETIYRRHSEQYLDRALTFLSSQDERFASANAYSFTSDKNSERSAASERK